MTRSGLGSSLWTVAREVARGGPPRVLVATLAALACLTAAASAQDIGSVDFKVQGELRLVGDPARELGFTYVNQANFPWPHRPLRSTGNHAESCIDVLGGTVVVDQYQPPSQWGGSWAPLAPGDAFASLAVPYQAVVPSFGGRYHIAPRIQLGSAIKETNDGPAIVENAEDYYLFWQRDSQCVMHCMEDPGVPPGTNPPPPGLPPHGTCLPASPGGPDCGCAQSPCRGDCDDPEPIDVQDQPFIENVGFLKIKIRASDLPSDSCGPPGQPAGNPCSCEQGRYYDQNPRMADVQIECRKLAATAPECINDPDSPDCQWTAKAGTAIGALRFGNPNTMLSRANRDDCTQEDVDAAIAIATDPSNPNCDPGNPDLVASRTGIYFALPAFGTGQEVAECRIWQAHALLNTCSGPLWFDLVERYFPPAERVRHPSGWWTANLDPIDTGELRTMQVTFDQVLDPAESWDVSKDCQLDFELAPDPVCHYASGPAASCCGPEWADLHGEIKIFDAACPARQISVDHIRWQLFLPAERWYLRDWKPSYDVISPRNTTNCGSLGQDVFQCQAVFPYALPPWPGTPPPEFDDPSCAWPCVACDPVCGEWKVTDTGMTSGANYKDRDTPLTGDWFSTAPMRLDLNDLKNRVYFAGIKGLHGLLMSDDPSLCEGDGLTAPWTDPGIYPNFDDIKAQHALVRTNPAHACYSPGLLETNTRRAVVDTSEPKDTAAFTICPASASINPGGGLADRYGELDFIRSKSYGIDLDPENDPVVANWVPDSTFCSALAEVPGVVRVLDGRVDLQTGTVTEIGLQNAYTLNRFPIRWDSEMNEFDAANPGRPADWASRDVCQDRATTAHSRMSPASGTYLHSFPTGSGGPLSTSNGGPAGETVLQSLWPTSLWPGQPHCLNEGVAESCLCGLGAAPADWPTRFGMDRLVNLADPLVHDDMEARYQALTSNPAFRLIGTYEGVETDYHTDQLLPLTNSVLASATTRNLNFHFANNLFVSGLDGEESPVYGFASVRDVGKPFQLGHPGYTLDSWPLPASFRDRVANPYWPALVRPRGAGPNPPPLGIPPGYTSEPWDSGVDPRTSVPQLQDLVERFSHEPGECQVENFGVCFGELRFKFSNYDPDLPRIVEGFGYFNALADQTIPLARPDLVSDWDRNGVMEFDLNQDGLPDQHLLNFTFKRLVHPIHWDSRGNPAIVTAFLPAGHYRVEGHQGSGAGTTLPIDIVVPCGGLVSNTPLCSVKVRDCSQDADPLPSDRGRGLMTGSVFTPSGYTLDDASWANTTIPLGGPISGVVGSTGLVAFSETVDLQDGCNELTATMEFTNLATQQSETVTCSTEAILDDVKPVIACPASVPVDLPPDACATSVTVHASVTDLCDSSDPLGCPAASRGPGRLLDFTATLAGRPPFSCDVNSPDPLRPECDFTPSLPCGTHDVQWDATDLAHNAADSCLTRIVVTDRTAPTVQTPAAMEDCYETDGEAIDDAETTVFYDACGPVPVRSSPPAPVFDPATCRLNITVTGTDSCGLEASKVYDPKVDGTDPTASGGRDLPGCYDDVDAVATAAEAGTTVDDNCPGVTKKHTEPLPVPDAQCRVTIEVWAVDACLRESPREPFTAKVDGERPTATRGADLLPCYLDIDDAVRDAETATTVGDNCPGVMKKHTEPLPDPAPGTCEVTIEVWAEDACGKVSDRVAQPVLYTTKVDAQAPTISRGEILPCYDTKEEAIDAALAATGFGDNCHAVLKHNDPDPDAQCVLVIDVWAEDDCGNKSEVIHYTTRIDDADPEVTGSLEVCLWPPNHKYVCLANVRGWFEVEESCAVASISYECESSQCDDAVGNGCPSAPPDSPKQGDRGDGHTINDCILCDCDNDGAVDDLCAREERAGNRKEGRYYGLAATVTDTCGRSTTATVGNIWVPHDQRTHPDCIFQGNP